jgi:hypothetical protein
MSNDLKMKCRHCEEDSNTGSSYKFYYGKHIGTEKPTLNMRVNKYLISGSISAYICRACVIKRTLFSLPGIAAILWIVSIALVVFRPAIDTSNPIAFMRRSGTYELGAYGIVFIGIFLLFYVFKHGLKWISKYGDALAIRAYRSELKAKGYDSFFTRAQYGRLDKAAKLI